MPDNTPKITYVLTAEELAECAEECFELQARQEIGDRYAMTAALVAAIDRNTEALKTCSGHLSMIEVAIQNCAEDLP